jgi:hypothetical protein
MRAWAPADLARGGPPNIRRFHSLDLGNLPLLCGRRDLDVVPDLHVHPELWRGSEELARRRLCPRSGSAAVVFDAGCGTFSFLAKASAHAKRHQIFLQQDFAGNG